ncbi:hypothetical protein ACFO1B_15290 [Dactylosporangium siamense]|uniref:hypothetical protein n=1 Tax=Dactylosporangium siamense TaxID=685454 RepID=UPI0019412C47|nr:hypothetical protein [Dactylosporangium siamense]
MRVFGSEFTLTTVSADAFAGQYTWYDDGWAGALTVSAHGDSALSGQYTSLRFGTTHRVTATVGGALPTGIALDIHDFNGLDAQRFTGCVGTGSRALIAGVTQWRDERYGFYAVRDAPRPIAAFRVGEVEPGDFAGRYTLRGDAGPVRVELTHTGGRAVEGVVHRPGDGPLPLAGAVDPDDPLLVTLTAGDAVLSVRLFSRPKNVLAGWIDVPGARIPCYLVRTA